VVLPGQFLERPVVVPAADGSRLDALYHRGVRAPACVLASPHPALGGSMTAPVLNELAWALARAGHPTLRFDYRGVGASQGRSSLLSLAALGLAEGGAHLEPGSLRAELLDLDAATGQLAATALGGGIAPAQLCAIGYSLGACVVASAALPPAGGAGASPARWTRQVLIAPPTAIFDFGPLLNGTSSTLLLCAGEDALCDTAQLQRLAARRPDRLRIEVVAHADHGFRRGAVELARLVVAWVGEGSGPVAGAPGEMDDPFSAPVELELEDLGGAPLELDDRE
jgi:alpha/beta superfamily hydrolase